MQITPENLEHIATGHSEIAIVDIDGVLGNPDEVRKSAVANPRSRCRSEPYHQRRRHEPNRFVTAVVKLCPDRNWLVTAYMADAMKAGEAVIRKEQRA